MAKKNIDTAEERLFDLKVHGMVGTEMEEGFVDKGAYTKALTDCGGDEARVNARYVELRVQMIKDELLVKSKEAKEKSNSGRPHAEAVKEALERATKHQNRVLPSLPKIT